MTVAELIKELSKLPQHCEIKHESFVYGNRHLKTPHLNLESVNEIPIIIISKTPQTKIQC